MPPPDPLFRQAAFELAKRHLCELLFVAEGISRRAGNPHMTHEEANTIQSLTPAKLKQKWNKIAPLLRKLVVEVVAPDPS